MTRQRVVFRELDLEFLSKTEREDLFQMFEKFYTGEIQEDITSDDLPDSIYDDYSIDVISKLIIMLNAALNHKQETFI